MASWGRPNPKVIIELQTNKPEGWAYWAARALIIIAAKLIGSRIVSKRTWPPLEVE